MINLSKGIIAWLITFVFVSPVVLAADKEELVEARQGLMMLYGVNMQVLTEMTQNERPYNKQIAQSAADNLLALSKMKTGALWPEGTSSTDEGYAGKSSAKTEIWQNRDRIANLQNKLISKVEVLVKDAAWSLEYLQDGVMDVSDACKACHKEFRAKK